MFSVDSNNKRGFKLYGDSKGSAILQCRGDSYGPKCHDCCATGLAGLSRRCRWYKGKIIWYDRCLLAISSLDSAGQIDYDNIFCMANAKKVGGDKLAFTRTWNTLIDNLTTLAASEDNYAAGETRFKDDMLYGMVQCTRDISAKACEKCLLYTLHFKDCLNDKRGGRVVGRSCTFRFEFYPFIAKAVLKI